MYRSTIVQSLLRGLLNVLGRGPRATVLWLIALACEVVLELLRSLQGGFDGPEYA